MVLNIFNVEHYTARRLRARAHINHFEDAFSYVLDDLEARLLMLNCSFKNILVIGSRHLNFQAFFEKMYKGAAVTQADYVKFHEKTVVLEDETLPFEKESFDLVLSFLHLHAVNDVPGVLVQAHKLLVKDGLFVSVMPGGETLYELRDALAKAEQKIYGAVSPRIYPFMSTQDLGDLLQRAGFNLPVVDRELTHVDYGAFNSILIDLSKWGETNCMVQKSSLPFSRGLIVETEKMYRKDFYDEGYRVSIDLIWSFAWSPAPNQQKPLKRGDFTVHLGDVLKKDS